MRKIILSMLGIFLIIGSFFLAKTIINSKKRFKLTPQKIVKTVFVAKVSNSAIPIVIKANGNLQAKQKVSLYAEVQGIFNKSNSVFKEGQAYKAGQAIIRINAIEYKATVQAAKSDFYNLLTSVMPDIRLDYPSIFSKWEKYLQDFDISKNMLQLPEMTTENEKFFISGRGLLSAYYNIINLEQRLSKYTITAPFNGTVTEVSVTEGTLVRVGQKLGEFIKTGIYELEVSIPKTYADMLGVGKSVRLYTLNSKREYTGEVSRINGKVDQATQTIKAFITVADDSLKEGMYLEANLDAKQEDNAIEVDRNLLLEDNKMYVVRDSILDVINVLPVYFSNKRVVLKNVPEGTTILSKPLIGAYKGMAVKIYGDKVNNEE